MKKMNGKVLEVEQEVSGGWMLTRVCDIRVALRRWEERRGLRSEYDWRNNGRAFDLKGRRGRAKVKAAGDAGAGA